MYPWMAVAVGGAIGSVARHGVNRLIHQEWPLLRFPLATIIVNVLGCCVIGLLAGFVATGRLSMSVNWREFVFVGILGGFTTFSTFGLDTITLIRTGDMSQAMVNVLVQVICGLGGVYVGLRVVEHIAVAGSV